MKTIAEIWWPSADLLRTVEEIKHSVPDDAFFCDPAYKPIREAWVAAKFAMARPYNLDWELFPVPEREQFPDLKFRAADNHQDVRNFEIAEADREGRRRCDEYRRAKGQADQLEFYDPAEEERIAPDEIHRVIKQKTQKKYRPKPNLLVYVNSLVGNQRRFMQRALAIYTATALKAFGCSGTVESTASGLNQPRLGSSLTDYGDSLNYGDSFLNAPN